MCKEFRSSEILYMSFPREQRTVQGETESEPVGSRTDTVERGNVGVLVG